MSDSLSAIRAALKHAGIEATESDGGVWLVPIQLELEAAPQTVAVISLDSPYLTTLCPLSPVSIDSLSQAQLKELIRKSSAVPLAKLETVPKGDGFVVTSECAWENLTADKLMRRVRACAKLASELRPVFRNGT